MTDAAVAALITAGGSFIVACVAGGIALWNRRKANTQSLEIAGLKGALDRDLARLNAKLSHGQLINSTQWNAEFAAYQAIWKAIVAVRPLAAKLVEREEELVKLGVPADYLDSADRLEIKKTLLANFLNATRGLLLAIHENAPFYPADIRTAANETHAVVKALIDQQMTAFTRLTATGVNDANDPRFIAESNALLKAIFEGVDCVEVLIRKRLAEVQVVNSASINE